MTRSTGLGSVDLNNLITAWPANSGTTAALIPTTTTVVPLQPRARPSMSSDTFTITVAHDQRIGYSHRYRDPADRRRTTCGDYNCAGPPSPISTVVQWDRYLLSASFTAAGHALRSWRSIRATATHAPSTGVGSVTIGRTSSGKGTFKLAATPATLTVAQGSQGTETISVTPAGGYTGTVNITYSTPSALSNLCIFAGTGLSSTGGIAVSSTAAVTGQLTIDANASDCSSSTTGGARRVIQPQHHRWQLHTHAPRSQSASGRIRFRRV